MAANAAGAVIDFLIASPIFREGAWAWSALKIAAAAPVMVAAAERAKLPPRIPRKEVCAWVDLRCCAGIDAYLAQLSANTRAQVRRAMRLLESRGVLDLRRAATLEEALVYLEELRALHEASWRRRNKGSGAFAYATFGAFVRRIVMEGYESGAVDLLKLSAGGETIGLLLNFIHDGHVYAYQSGFAHFDDNRIKPGLAAHVHAVSRYAASGCEGYHFMAGAARYKESLGTATESLTWLEFRRDALTLRIEDGLRALKARLTGKQAATKILN
jgi:hypothetical protein